MATQERIEALKQRKAKLEREIAVIEARERDQQRKDDTRIKVLIGAGMLADAKLNPATAVFVREVLERSILAERDRIFLQGKGWLSDGGAEAARVGAATAATDTPEATRQEAA